MSEDLPDEPAARRKWNGEGLSRRAGFGDIFRLMTTNFGRAELGAETACPDNLMK